MEFLAGFDLVATLKIIMIDLLLGLDNAIVIALACATLAVSVRNKAIFYGTAGAIGLRIVLLAVATFLLTVPYLKLAAGAYLLFIGYSLLTAHEDDPDVQPQTSIGKAVWTIIVADFMLSLDNVMGVAGAASQTEHAVLYSVIGVLITIPVIVYGAKYLAGWIDRFPVIVWFGAGMIGLVGAEMIVTDAHFIEYFGHVNDLIAKAVGAGIVIGAAAIQKRVTA